MNRDSLLFVHHLCHKSFAYHLEDIHEDNWITRYFFSGGTMPSANLYLYFQEDLPSSSSRLKAHFVGMGYSATLVDKIIKEHGQRDENLILEALFGYTDPPAIVREMYSSSNDESPIIDDGDDD